MRTQEVLFIPLIKWDVPNLKDQSAMIKSLLSSLPPNYLYFKLLWTLYEAKCLTKQKDLLK